MSLLRDRAASLLRIAKRSPRLKTPRVLYRRLRNIPERVRDWFPVPRHPPIDELRRLDPKLPFGIILEPTNACNAKCVFCPVSQRGDDFTATHLDEGVFDRLLEEIAGWPATLQGYVQMVGLGEPTVARNFARNLQRIREAIPPRYTIALNTNGTTLHSDKVVSAIIGVVDSLTISINGHDEESYRVLNGIPGFQETLEKAVAFLKRKNEPHFRVPATRVQVMRTVYEDQGALAAFNKRITPLLGELDSIHRQPLQTLAGVEEPIAKLQAREDKEREALIHEIPIPCFQVWDNVFITAEGDVYPCCIAGNVDGRENRKEQTGLYLGSIHEKPLAELWNGEARKELMRRHLDNEKPEFCKRCPNVTEYDIRHWRRSERHARAVEEALRDAPSGSHRPKRRLPLAKSA